MSLDLGTLVKDLDGILHIKRAAAQLEGGQGGGAVEKGNVVDGSATATQGAGYSPPRADQGKDGDGQGLDQGVSPTQKSDPNRSVAYNKDQPSNQGQGNETKTVTGGNQNADSEVEGSYSENPLKAAAQANALLKGLEALLKGASAPAKPAPAPVKAPTPQAKAAGRNSAEQLLARLVQNAMQKKAMDASEIAAKWDSMSAEEKAKCEADYPEECAKAKEMMKGKGDAPTEKMSAIERRTYELNKLAGQQTALQLLQQLQGGAGQMTPAQMQQKQAELDYMASHQLGQQAADRAWAEQQAKQAAAQAPAQTLPYQHPLMAPQVDPAVAYNEMLKMAQLAGINPNGLHDLLAQVAQSQKTGGPPVPFVDRGHINKQAVDIGPIRRILTGLLDEQVISQEEADAIRNRVGAAENLDERTLMSLVQGVGNPQAVLERLLAGDVQELQRNTQYAPAPTSAMPATQPTIPATTAEKDRTVSQGGAMPTIPGSTESMPPGVSPEGMVIEAACRKILSQLDPAKYGGLVHGR